MTDKAAAPAAKIAYAPPSLSVRVRCAVNEKHSMSGLFVILRMAVAGPAHASLDKVVAVHDGTDVKDPNAPPAENPDAAALAVKFVCTIVDMHGFLQPVHDDSNPWHEIFSPDPPLEAPKKGVASKSRDMARIPVDTDGKFVGCLLRHPQPSMARALTKWLNTGDDSGGHGFDKWTKPRSAPLAGEKPLGGRELLARELDLSKDTAGGTGLLLKVSEDAADFLPPKFESRDGWLLYYDMPHANCDPVKKQVKVLQRRLGLLRFPIGGESNIYAPDALNDGSFDTRTLSAVTAFQQHAALGKAVAPLAWPPKHTDASDGSHDFWFVVGKDVDVDKLDGVIPSCADEKTWAAIDKWVELKVRKPGMILVKNPQTYMRWDAALSVIAWRKIIATFGVHYPAREDSAELSSGYSIASFNAGLELDIAHPHKTGHALDFSVVGDEVGPLSDYATPRPWWPIIYEGQWWVWRMADLDPTPGPRAKLNTAKTNQKNAIDAQKKAVTTEGTTQTALDTANAASPLDARKQKAAQTAHDNAVTARGKADKAVSDSNDAVDRAQKDLEAAQAKFQANKNDPEHRGWAIHFRLYGHSRLDVFGTNAKGAIDELYQSISGMTASLKKSVAGYFGDTPAEARDAFLDEHLKFLSDWEQKLMGDIGAPEAPNAAGRALVLGKLFRATVRQWVLNPYSRAAGRPGDEIHPGAPMDSIDYVDVEKKESWKPIVPPGAKSFLNLTYIGWICKMHRISGTSWKLRDPRKDGQKAPRQTLSPVKTFFGRIVGLADRMNRDDSNEKDEPLVCKKDLSRKLTDLDLEFMKRWARALPAMRPEPPQGVPVVVTTSDPQVKIELVAADEAYPQLETVFKKLDESGKNLFVLVDLGQTAILDPDMIAESGKPGLVKTDQGKIDTGAAWKAKLENVATLFKDKVVPAKLPAAAKVPAPGKKKTPIRSLKHDPKDWQITLQPVFEKAPPAALEGVAFQPSHACEMPTPGHGEPLEWWHYQHESSINILYPAMLREIGYAAELLFRPRQPPKTDTPDTYSGRGTGANPVQEGQPSFQIPKGTLPKEPENAETESAMVW